MKKLLMWAVGVPFLVVGMIMVSFGGGRGGDMVWDGSLVVSPTIRGH